ncbi:hypothetical protein HDU84_006614, partial [Entophlyctis sp. JEL0112]
MHSTLSRPARAATPAIASSLPRSGAAASRVSRVHSPPATASRVRMRSPLSTRYTPIDEEYDFHTFGPPAPNIKSHTRLWAISVLVVVVIVIASVIGIVLRYMVMADASPTPAAAASTSAAGGLYSGSGMTIAGTSTASTAPSGSAAAPALFASTTSVEQQTWTITQNAIGTSTLTSSSAQTTSAMTAQASPSGSTFTAINVAAVYWASTADSSASCQLPEATFASGLTGGLNIGSSAALGELAYTAAYCGHVVSINCGYGSVNTVVAGSCGPDCGLTLASSTWALATGGAAAGQTTCSVSLTAANALASSQSPVCYYRPGSEFANSFNKILGVLNSAGRLVSGAALDGIAG